MLKSHQHESALDLACGLAEEIARTAPECGEKAMRLVAILEELKHSPDQSFIQDATEAETLDSDLSETRVRSAAAAVVRAIAK